MTDVPESHPRYLSLRLRDAIVAGVDAGMTSAHGLIAHGRGEAFDYLLGEATGPWAMTAIDAAAARLLTARHPVLSVNGNAVALVGAELVALSEATGAPLEVNIFHTSAARERAIASALQRHGAREVLLPDPDTALPGLDSNRRLVHPRGILEADVIFVPLEDGDRCEALRRLGREVITIDLNPLSRTARTASITIVDNVARALPVLVQRVAALAAAGASERQALIDAYDHTHWCGHTPSDPPSRAHTGQTVTRKEKPTHILLAKGTPDSRSCRLKILSAGIDEIAARTGFSTPCLTDWVGRDRYDEYWAQLDQDHMYGRVTVPGLHAGGWFDHLTRTQYEAYRAITDHGASDVALAGQRMLIGPWGHQTISTRGPSHTTYGDWDFGPQADLDVLDHELRFLNLHLQDMDDGLSEEPPVRVFLMGENRWVDLDDWPASSVVVENWDLGGDGASGTLRRDGPGTGGGRVFTYDPKDPVPTLGGAVYWGLEQRGPVDQRPNLSRPDILSYRSDPLAAPLTVIGEMELMLHIACDREDTDIVARLCVEQADGAVICLSLGSVRCRFREDPATPQPLEPDTPTQVRVRLGQTAYIFAPGSRIVLTVTGSDFPRILPHPNRIAPLFEGDPLVARTTILHGAEYPSRLHLPIVDGV